MKCCTFPLHKKGGHVKNEWLAHLRNPQLKSQQLQDLKGVMLPKNKKALSIIPLSFYHNHTI